VRYSVGNSSCYRAACKSSIGAWPSSKRPSNSARLLFLPASSTVNRFWSFRRYVTVVRRKMVGAVVDPRSQHAEVEQTQTATRRDETVQCGGYNYRSNSIRFRLLVRQNFIGRAKTWPVPCLVTLWPRAKFPYVPSP